MDLMKWLLSGTLYIFSIALGLFQFLLLAGCAPTERIELSNEENLSNIYDRYNDDLDIAEAAYANDDIIALSSITEKLLKYKLPEAPNYLPYFFISFLEYKNHDIKSSASTLQDFKCMLKVDEGVNKCFDPTQAENLTKLCYDTMCGEIYLSHYERPTKDNLYRISKYWAYVEHLEKALNE